MKTGRLEAFSDGVIAIVITIMVLELKAPVDKPHFADLLPQVSAFLSYILSFIYLGIYWNNHHHLLHVSRHVSGSVLWANLHLLFWLSLIPFVTAWMGENEFAPAPTAAYGVVLLCAAIAYLVLQSRLVAVHGRDSTLSHALGRDRKGRLSVVLYAAAIPLAFVHGVIADAIYVGVALVWLIPDRRIERALEEEARG